MFLVLFPFYCIQYTLLWARKMILEFHENQQSISWDCWSLRNLVSFSQGMSFSQLPSLPEVRNQVPSSSPRDLTPHFSRGESLTRAGPGTGLSGELVWRERLGGLFSLWSRKGARASRKLTPGSGCRHINTLGKVWGACADSSPQLWGLSIGTKGLLGMSFLFDWGTPKLRGSQVWINWKKTVNSQMLDVENWRWYISNLNILPGLRDDVSVFGWLGTGFLPLCQT